MNNAYNEEESRRARIFQREKRQELQLIIDRCNQIDFDYVKVPSERTDNVVFGSSKPRKIHFFAEDKSVNSFMRRCFKEHFPERIEYVKDQKKSSDEQLNVVEQKPHAVFASKVPRFQEILSMDSSQIYRRRKKGLDVAKVEKINYAPFGSGCQRILMHTRDINLAVVPTCSYVPSKKISPNIHYSFGGKITIDKAYDLICSPKVVDPKCVECECEPKNVYWKSSKTHKVLCRACYNKKLFDIKNKSRGVVDKYKILQSFQRDYKKKRLCNFFHQHNGTRAAVLLLTRREYARQKQKENFLNTIMKY